MILYGILAVPLKTDPLFLKSVFKPLESCLARFGLDLLLCLGLVYTLRRRFEDNVLRTAFCARLINAKVYCQMHIRENDL